jgi:ankyrin repeat protein
LESDPSPADSISLLLDHYATNDDANQADNSGSTPLHVAASLCNLPVATVLIESAAADVNAKRNDGKTPLDMLYLRIKEELPELDEVRFVDDLEKRTWDRKLDKMRRLLESHGARRS